MLSGTAMAAELGLKSSVYSVHLFGSAYPMYAAVPALMLNLTVTVVLTTMLRLAHVRPARDTTDPAAYVG